MPISFEFSSIILCSIERQRCTRISFMFYIRTFVHIRTIQHSSTSSYWPFTVVARTSQKKKTETIKQMKYAHVQVSTLQCVNACIY